MALLFGTRSSAQLYKGVDRAGRYRGARPGDWIPAWTPTALPGVLGWWDAAHAPSLVLDGAAVSEWRSRVGGFHVSATDWRRPTWSPTGRAGRPAVIFDGGQALGRYYDAGMPSGGAASTLVVVASLEANGFWSSVIGFGGRNGGTERSIMTQEDRRNLVVDFCGFWADTGLYWDRPRIVCAGCVEGGGTRIHVDGGAPAVSGTGFATAAAGSVFIGSHPQGDLPWPGTVQEALIIDRVMTDADRQRLEGYLAHRWDLSASLPAGHPYKGAPP